MNHILGLKEFNTTQHLYRSRPALESKRLESYLLDYRCHVRQNKYDDDEDEGDWHFMCWTKYSPWTRKERREVDFSYLRLKAFTSKDPLFLFDLPVAPCFPVVISAEAP